MDFGYIDQQSFYRELSDIYDEGLSRASEIDIDKNSSNKHNIDINSNNYKAQSLGQIREETLSDEKIQILNTDIKINNQ